MSLFRTVTQFTIHNCFVKCGHVKNNQEGSDVTEMDGCGEDDVTQYEDWVQLGQAPLVWTLTPTCLWTRNSRHVVCCV
jgi:hypothetical protein